MAVLSGLQCNRRYLYGTRFEVIGDHQPLIPMNKSHSRALPVRVAKHISKLGGFDFTLGYKPGSTTPSDYGSRHPPPVREYTAQERADFGVEDSDEEAELIVNRIDHEMPDAFSLTAALHQGGRRIDGVD